MSGILRDPRGRAMHQGFFETLAAFCAEVLGAALDEAGVVSL